MLFRETGITGDWLNYFSSHSYEQAAACPLSWRQLTISRKTAYRDAARSNTLTAPLPPSLFGAELNASTSWCWRSQLFSRFFSTGAWPPVL
jgi:hypothetical protein